MADTLTREQRSYCMSRIRSGKTTPEVLLRKLLWKLGYRYRITSQLPGKPDLIFPVAKIAIFVDGCFWHGCPKHSVKPKSNITYWRKKLKRNIERDKEVIIELERMGWVVLRFWEHDIKEDIEKCIIHIKKLF